MSLSEITSLYRAKMRARSLAVQELFAVIGIAIGVALLFASQVASTSLDNSVHQLTRQVVGSTQWQLEAPGPEGFSASLAARAEHLPGVAAAMPVLEHHIAVTGPRGTATVDLFGADPRFAHIGSKVLHHFSANSIAHQQAIALPQPLASRIGANALETIHVQVDGTVRESLLGAVLSDADIGGLVHGDIAFAPIAYAQSLTGMTGEISRLFLRVRHGQEKQAKANIAAFARTAHLYFAPADFDAQLFSIAAAPAQKGEWLFSALSAIVGFLFAFNAMLLTLPARRDLIETMRRRGTTRLMTVQMLLFDALVIGVLACILGLILGELLSIYVFNPQPGYLAYAFPVGTQRIVTLSTVLISLAAGLTAALVGVLAPVRSIVKRSLRNLSEQKGGTAWAPGRVVAGLLCIAATALILTFDPQQAVPGSLILVLALLALLPLLFQGALSLLHIVQRATDSTALKIALAELGDPMTRVRALAVAATGAIAVFGSVAILGAQSNLQGGFDRTAREWNHITQIWVSQTGSDNTLGVTPFSDSNASKVAALRSVASVSIYRGSFLNLGQRRLWVIAPPTTAPHAIATGQLVSGDPATVNARLKAHAWAVVSEAIASELHLHVGSTFTLPSPIPTRFTVAALSTNSGWPPGSIVINADDYAAAWGTSAASAFNITVKPGISAQQARAEVQRALGPASGLSVQTAQEREAEWIAASHQGLARLSQIGTLMLIAAILAMAAVMSSMIWQRRRRIAYIKRHGLTRGQLWRALWCESAILLGAGCSIGAGFGLFGQILLSHALRDITGFPTSIALTPVLALASIGFVSLAALAIVALPGYRAVSVRASTSYA
jgi:putative ABC transport system permease protein